jgi:hypothetical protein
MSAMSDYLEGEIIKHIFRSGSFTKPAALAIGLLTTAPNDAGGGSEVAGNNYARVQVNPGDANWTAPTIGNGVTANVSAITFPTPSASWGTITHFGVYDAASGGNLLFHGALTQSKVTNGGDTISFAAGALQFTFA